MVCEVFNLFASCIPQDGLSRIKRGRKGQGLVPDFKLSGEQGGEENLCELKCRSASVSGYLWKPQPADGSKGVDRRADGLTRESLSLSQRYGQWTLVCGPMVRSRVACLGPGERRVRRFMVWYSEWHWPGTRS